MKRPVTYLIAGLVAALSTSAIAQPYCPALLDEAQLEKKYKRLAPIHSSQDTGWVFTRDMMRETYAMKPQALALFNEIVGEFDAAGVQLAVLVAPPRPVIAGQDIVDATIGVPGQYDVAAAANSFATMLDQINASGAIAPNLMTVAQTHDSYFFKRDTHWTNTGAALSANALAHALSLDGLDVSALPVLETENERGSLSDIVDATCGARDAAEATPIYDYTAQRTNGDLLGDSDTGSRVALLGTSYSNRYKRDAYQAADALATALDREIDNFSTSGGGMIGTIEAYVLSGALAEKRHEMVIWEFPYTGSLNSVSALRQLLGAMRADRVATEATRSVQLDDKGRAEFALSDATAPFDLLKIQGLGPDVRQVMVDVLFKDDSKTTIKVRRSTRVAYPDGASWTVDLTGMDPASISKIKLRANADAAGADVSLHVGA